MNGTWRVEKASEEACDERAGKRYLRCLIYHAFGGIRFMTLAKRTMGLNG